MKKRHHGLLQFVVEIDQQVATGDEVDLGKWRVFDQAVSREANHASDGGVESKPILLRNDELFLKVQRNIRQPGKRINSVSRNLQHAFVNVGRENLDIAVY